MSAYPMVKVRPLQWAFADHTGYWWANSACGHYRAWEIARSGQSFFRCGNGSAELGGATVEEAKRAAEADHEKRILSAIGTPSPHDKEGEK